MSPTRPRASGARQHLDLLEPRIRGLIIDLDGVLWKEAEPIGDLRAVFSAIAATGLRVTLATNNAMKTVEDYRQKLLGFGVDLAASQIITSAEATADTLAGALPDHGPVFIVGERGVAEAVANRGFDVVMDPEDRRSCAAVVAGIDRELSYAKLERAATLIRQGALFYGTNPDPTFPTPGGLVPGAGSILAALAAAAEKQPIVIGKPSPLLFQMAARRMGLPPEDILVVGDRLATDVAGGQAFGARTALVLSGVSTIQQAREWKPPPTLVAASLSDLLGV